MNSGADEIRRIIETEGRYVSTSVGFSMKPMLRSRRDTVVIVPKTGRLKKYDVPLYAVGEKLILHRVVRVLPDGYNIRGDNCAFTERGISDSQILGVLLEFWRGEKEIRVTDTGYRIYSRIWVWSYPVRYFYKKSRSGLAALVKKITEKGNRKK